MVNWFSFTGKPAGFVFHELLINGGVLKVSKFTTKVCERTQTELAFFTLWRKKWDYFVTWFEVGHSWPNTFYNSCTLMAKDYWEESFLLRIGGIDVSRAHACGDYLNSNFMSPRRRHFNFFNAKGTASFPGNSCLACNNLKERGRREVRGECW